MPRPATGLPGGEGATPRAPTGEIRKWPTTTQRRVRLADLPSKLPHQLCGIGVRTIVGHVAAIAVLASGRRREPGYVLRWRLRGSADSDAEWLWQSMPEGLIYRSYLAGTKESRFSAHVINEADLGWIWDATLGTRVGLLRYGTRDPLWPMGFQIDAEARPKSAWILRTKSTWQALTFEPGFPSHSASGVTGPSLATII